jgi:hypothetical protein
MDFFPAYLHSAGHPAALLTLVSKPSDAKLSASGFRRYAKNDIDIQVAYDVQTFDLSQICRLLIDSICKYCHIFFGGPRRLNGTGRAVHGSSDIRRLLYLPRDCNGGRDHFAENRPLPAVLARRIPFASPNGAAVWHGWWPSNLSRHYRSKHVDDDYTDHRSR